MALFRLEPPVAPGAVSGTPGPLPGPEGGAERRVGPLLLPAETWEWGSPDELVRRYADLWADGAFDLDVAASAELHVCSRYFTVDDDGLSLPWRGRCWMNPPYGRAEELWVAKAVREVVSGRAELVAALLPAKVGKAWWFRYVSARRSERGVVRLRYPAAAVDFIRGRVRYVRPDGRPASVAGFPSVAILFQDWLRSRRLAEERAAGRQLSLPIPLRRHRRQG